VNKDGPLGTVGHGGVDEGPAGDEIGAFDNEGEAFLIEPENLGAEVIAAGVTLTAVTDDLYLHDWASAWNVTEFLDRSRYDVRYCQVGAAVVEPGGPR
jgi:hypothetical protein